MALLFSAPASAALINSYDFNGDLTDSLGNGADLVASGGSLATSGRYSFDSNQGLRLTDALSDPENYAIEIKFQMVTNEPFWKKVIDYQDLTSDFGVYMRSSSLSFAKTGDDAIASTGIPTATEFVATITRDGGTGSVSGFVNGVLEFSFNDAGNEGVAGGNILNFFIDDNGGSEALVGSVDYIRIYDQPDTTVAEVPEPTTMALFGAGLVWLGAARRRKAA